MAKITIELDTSVGDTLAKVLDAVLTGVVPVREVASPDAFDPNAYKAPAGSTDVVFTEATPPTSFRVAAPDSAAPQPAVNVASTAMLATVSEKTAVIIAPALGPMDGDRKRGEAAPGHRRRTNAQIAEDNAYVEQKVRAEAALKEMDKGVEARGEADAAAYAAYNPSISTGEERVNPEDEADEAAETAARAGDGPTLEDLRAAVARYIEKFGHAASVRNMQSIIGSRVADFEKASADDIAAAIAKVDFVIADGAVKTDAPAEPKKPVTKADVVEALLAYAVKYDGSTDQDKMPNTKEDMPKVFAATFGSKVTGMGSMPDQKPETLGKILSAIKAATDQNPFKREAKS